ncbi:calcineurin-like phosphoesterase C-terminal domain-containing protein [Lysobacter sp. KIS68-7]|uniref:calcineurin-like phosphoesterase C-terminal domain-containing protein n=1 Tax=Lysobacter sp. KIS68-7 TaxID=2904252 RepID=UPI001E50BC5F|nr:calcineurin-like phosphoesterase C-terminal domain-containing protein [Lysobacter sp. KIS68-7]UHQ21119.1 calcineurin-like phosphoesterase C-terminal domain-containing protein [Lysobacter sp. KIS68-7]
MSAGAADAPTDSIRILVFGDPQPNSPAAVDYYARDIVASAMPAAKQSVVGITLGDVANDQPALYPGVKAATERLGIPWLYAPGNHDIDHDATSDAESLRSFHAAFGDDTRLWKHPLANVVVLDDVVALPGQSPAYIGGLREDQFARLETWLPTLPRDRLLVIAAHIPFFDISTTPGRESFRSVDRARLFALLKPFPHVLLLSAHTHNQRHFFHDAKDGWQGATPLHEYNVGAACGAFWSGVADAQGIPDAMMSDGTPNGFATLQVKRGGDYALAWHPARDPADTQIALHAPKVLRRGAYPAWGVFANVFMGRDDTRVEFRVDAGEWKPMVHVVQPDPRVAEENAKDDAADQLRGFDRSPEAEPSQHLWRAALPATLAAGTHEVEVRAFDAWRGEVRAKTTYRLDEGDRVSAKASR